MQSGINQHVKNIAEHAGGGGRGGIHSYQKVNKTCWTSAIKPQKDADAPSLNININHYNKFCNKELHPNVFFCII